MSLKNKKPSFLRKISSLKIKIKEAIIKEEVCFLSPGEFRKWMIETQLSYLTKKLSITLPAKMIINHNEYYIYDQSCLADHLAYSFYEFFPPIGGELIFSSSQNVINIH